MKHKMTTKEFRDRWYAKVDAWWEEAMRKPYPVQPKDKPDPWQAPAPTQKAPEPEKTPAEQQYDRLTRNPVK